MNELERYINKEKQKKWLEVFMILAEINEKEDIISFTYDKNYLTVQTEKYNYIRINLEDEGVEENERNNI